MQTEIIFPTASPVNTARLSGQNLRLYDWLSAGNTIHVFHHAMRTLKIGYLNSRISDLINEHEIPIDKRWVQVLQEDGESVSVVEYSMKTTR